MEEKMKMTLNTCGSKMNMMMRAMITNIVLTMFHVVIMIWDGWDILLEKVIPFSTYL